MLEYFGKNISFNIIDFDDKCNSMGLPNLMIINPLLKLILTQEIYLNLSTKMMKMKKTQKKN